MKALFCSAALALIVLTSNAQNKDAVTGIWQNPTGEARIQIFKKAEKYFGKIIWLKEPTKDNKPKIDSKNPNPNLKSQPVMGLELLKDFKFKGDNEWGDGTIYDPKSGKTYSCKISLAQSDKLDVRGYIGISLIGRTETWIRVK